MIHLRFFGFDILIQVIINLYNSVETSLWFIVRLIRMDDENKLNIPDG
jgi:hypothetical protein